MARLARQLPGDDACAMSNLRPAKTALPTVVWVVSAHGHARQDVWVKVCRMRGPVPSGFGNTVSVAVRPQPHLEPPAGDGRFDGVRSPGRVQLMRTQSGGARRLLGQRHQHPRAASAPAPSVMLASLAAPGSPSRSSVSADRPFSRPFKELKRWHRAPVPPPPYVKFAKAVSGARSRCVRSNAMDRSRR